MSDFKSQQEIWQYLIDGGKVCTIDSKPGEFLTFNGGFISSEGGEITECGFFRSHNWKKYIEPKKKKVITLYRYTYIINGEIEQTRWLSTPKYPYASEDKIIKTESKETEVDDE